MRASTVTIAFITLLCASEAQAGGIGVVTTGGLHQAPVYVYDADLQQYKVNQGRPNVGFGIQAVLGDRDDRVQGTLKLYYQLDAAQTDSGVLDKAKNDGASGDLVFAYDKDPRNLGMATVGVQWGLFKDPGAIQPVLITNIGAGVLTNDNSEFAMAQVGPGMYWSLTEQLQLNAELTYDLRYRKTFFQSTSATVGLRFLFD